MPPPVPSSVHPFAIAANFVLVVVAMSSLVYFLQKTRYRYSLLFMFAVMTAVPLYFALGPLIAMLFGREAAGWYQLAVYFSPIAAALAVKFSIYPRLKWPLFRSIWMRGQPSFDDCVNVEDAIAAGLKLEMRGDWRASIDLYRRAAQRWPEHAAYVQRCIARVTEMECHTRT